MPLEEDKKQESSDDSSSPGPSTPQSSPPKGTTMADFGNTMNGVTNMALAHELVMNKDFALQEQPLPENSLEKAVHDIVHKAFWDKLKTDFESDPPNYKHTLVLFAEIKETLQSFLPQVKTKLHTEIDEVLDLELIEQRANNGALDMKQYASFITAVMGKLCAPARDDEIKGLSDITDPLQLFKEIFRILNLMKLDMANYTLQSLRPQLLQQSVEYERAKFQEFLKTSENGLSLTELWLTESGDQLLDSTDGPTDGPTSSSPGPPSPMTILIQAYMKLLSWDDEKLLPQTLIMDEGRFLEVRDKAKRLILMASILLVTYTNVGSAISGIEGFLEKLKHIIELLLNEAKSAEEGLVNVSEQLVKEVNECLSKHGYPQLDEGKESALKTQIQAVGDMEHAVHRVMDARVKEYLRMVIASAGGQEVLAKVPQGLHAVQKELVEVAKRFHHLVNYNKAVFGPIYSKILSSYLQSKGQVE